MKMKKRVPIGGKQMAKQNSLTMPKRQSSLMRESKKMDEMTITCQVRFV
jgi:hypothetical protein